MQEIIEKVEINIPRLKNTLEEKGSLQAMQLVIIPLVGLTIHNWPNCPAVIAHDHLCTQQIFDTSQIYKELQDNSSLLQELLVGSLNYSEAICGIAVIIEILIWSE